MVRIECSRCGEIMSARSHFDAEIKFNAHKCKGLRNLKDLPFSLLTKLVQKQITEAQAWAEFDAIK